MPSVGLIELSGVTGWRLHDLRRTCVSGMARLGVAPHVADKILNHQVGAISGVAAVYQRHDFLSERRAALDLWGAHIVNESHGRSPAHRYRSKNRSMTAVLLFGYVTILEAADLLSRAMYAGVRDLPVVSRHRKEGLNVRDGQARYRAIAEIWKAVDEDRLRAVAIGGRPRRILRLDP